eukprot:ANDGO_06619.mRNA.1 Vacuolar protein sorting-associated protein 9
MSSYPGVELSLIRGSGAALNAAKYPEADRIITYLWQYSEQSMHVIAALERQVQDGRTKLLELQASKRVSSFSSIEEQQEFEFLKLQINIAEKRILFERLVREICEETTTDICQHPDDDSYKISVADYVGVFERVVRTDSRSVPILAVLLSLQTSLYATMRYVKHVHETKMTSGRGIAQISAEVSKFLEADDRPSAVKPTLTETQTQHIDAFLSRCAAESQFIMNAKQFVEELVTLEGEHSNPDPELIAVVEDAVFPKYYTELMQHCALECKEEDAQFQERCQQFSSISQKSLYINDDFISLESFPYMQAVAYLRTVYFGVSPTRKLRTFLHAAQAVYRHMEEMRARTSGKVQEIAADEFLPVLIFTVLKANVRDICSQLQFVKTYASDRFMNGEMGYYLSSVELAVEYIKNLSSEKLCPSKSPSLLRKFAFPERQKYLRWAATDSHVSLLSPDVVLKGYQLFAIQDWILSPARLVSTVLKRTGCSSDIVHLCSVRINEKATEMQLDFLTKTFLQFPLHSGFTSEDTVHGTVVTFESDESHPALAGLHFIPVRSGDYDSEVVSIVDDLMLHRVTDADRLIQLLGVQTLREVVTYVQECLIYFDLIMTVLPSREGVLDDVVVFGITQFQKSRDLKGCAPGHLDVATLAAIRSRAEECSWSLKSINYLDSTFNPKTPAVFAALTAATKQFQKQCGLFPDGRMGTKTLMLLNKIVQGDTSAEEERHHAAQFLRKVSGNEDSTSA